MQPFGRKEEAMKTGINGLCARCKWGARVEDKGQCGCPGIDLTKLEEYAALRGYSMAYERGAFVFLMARETKQVQSSRNFSEMTQNTIAAAMVSAAGALGTCGEFNARTPGEGDEWKLYHREGGKA